MSSEISRDLLTKVATAQIPSDLETREFARYALALLDELEAARFKLSGAPGTISGRMRGVLDFAEQECGHKSHSAKPGEAVLMERFLEMRTELEAARALKAEEKNEEQR